MYIAHVRSSDKEIQSLEDHLLGVAKLTQLFASKINQGETGYLIGLMHDFGKYSDEFQRYIKACTGMSNNDQDGESHSPQRGSVDHSTAGSQWIYLNSSAPNLIKKILSIVIASHHSGLINAYFLSQNTLLERLHKDDSRTHHNECDQNACQLILDQAHSLVSSEHLTKQMSDLLLKMIQNNNYFNTGHLTKFLFSCLIDADRIDSANFEFPEYNLIRNHHKKINWDDAISKLEHAISQFEVKNFVDEIRAFVADTCLDRAQDQQGVYNLTVPTGGGKTLSSLRYALHHAKKHDLDRIIFVIPYTSIIEQNASAVTNILGQDWVLEVHSNLEPEHVSWQNKLISQNWDAPIVFITQVQFLDVNFSGGTRDVRKMHQIARSVVIFDEVQTLPLKCVHLFANAVNFFKNYTQTTFLLCTATQPPLANLKQSRLGQIELSESPEIIESGQGGLQYLYESLERVRVNYDHVLNEIPLSELVMLILNEFKHSRSVLVIVNTKSLAARLFNACAKQIEEQGCLFHLSTNMCPAHRKQVLDGPQGIKYRLASKQPTLCISTQLIEAGVDVSFNTVFRSIAGLDSVMQAAGRCNRHGENIGPDGAATKGILYIVDCGEKTESLEDIHSGANCTRRIIRDVNHGDLKSVLGLSSIHRYFDYFYNDINQYEKMSYSIDYGRKDNLINLLSKNNLNSRGSIKDLNQSFSEAAKHFNVIDQGGTGIIVPYDKGKHVVNNLLSLEINDPLFFKKIRKILNESHIYSINIYQKMFNRLYNSGLILQIHNTGIFVLNNCAYSESLGVFWESSDNILLSF